mgnify:CR=1 FL=1
MAWDVALPADNSKLREGPQQIRNNFAAIVTADQTFTPAGLNLAQQGGDLALMANTYRLFSKSDGTSTQLYGIDPNGVVTQFTSSQTSIGANGRIGIGGVIFAWGTSTVSSGGTVSVAGITTLYNVNANTSIGSGNPSPLDISNLSGNQFTVRGGTAGSFSIMWQAIGV